MIEYKHYQINLTNSMSIENPNSTPNYTKEQKKRRIELIRDPRVHSKDDLERIFTEEQQVHESNKASVNLSEKITETAQEEITTIAELSQDFNTIISKLESSQIAELSNENDSEAQKWLDQAISLGQKGGDRNEIHSLFLKIQKMEDRLNEARAQRERKVLFEKGEIMKEEIELSKKDKRKQIVSGVLDFGKGVGMTVPTVLSFGLGLGHQYAKFKESVNKIRDALNNKKYDKYGYDYTKYYAKKDINSL